MIAVMDTDWTFDESTCFDKILSRQLVSADRMPLDCPLCGASDSFHSYFYRNGASEIGSGWSWCSRCRRFSHGRWLTPAWWVNSPDFPLSVLAVAPEALENNVGLVDAHWNSLVLAVGSATNSPS